MPIPGIAAGAVGAGGRLASSFSRSPVGTTSNILNTTSNITPKLEERCRCIIHGNPDSSLYQMYWMACAIVFSMIKRRDVNQSLPPNGFIKIEYSPVEKYMCFAAHQSSSYISFATTTGDRTKGITLFTGPLSGNRVVGGRWQWNSLLPRLPGGPGSINLSNLGWENRVIFNDTGYYTDIETPLTPSYGPTPPGDETSRGFIPVADEVARTNGDTNNWYKNPDYILYAALTTPCSTDGKVLQKVDITKIPIPAGALSNPPRFPDQPPKLSPGEQYLSQQQQQ